MQTRAPASELGRTFIGLIVMIIDRPAEWTTSTEPCLSQHCVAISTAHNNKQQQQAAAPHHSTIP